MNVRLCSQSKTFMIFVIISDDIESMYSYGSGSIRSGARSPKKKVKLWHPSQDNVSPFLHESTERNMRRRLNSTVSMDNSTQTPEKEKEQKSASPKLSASNESIITSDNLDANISGSPVQKMNEKRHSKIPKTQRNLDFEEPTCSNIRNPPDEMNNKTNEKENSTVQLYPSTSSEVRAKEIILNPRKPKRMPSLDSISSIDSINDENRRVNHLPLHSNDEATNDDHLFRKPNSCSTQAGGSNTPGHKWKVNKKAKGFKFFDSSASPKKL